MSTLSFESPSLHVTVTASNGLTVASADIVALLVSVAALGNAVVGGMDKVVCKPTATPSIWSYRLTATDGRVWKQTFDVTTPDTGITFDVAEYWRLSEIDPHRAVRATCLNLIMNHGLTEMTAHWTP